MLMLLLMQVHRLTGDGGGGCGRCSESDLARTWRFSSADFGFLFSRALFVELNSLDDYAVLSDLVLSQHVVESVIRTADFAVDPISGVLHHVVPQLIWPSKSLVTICALVFVRIIFMKKHVSTKRLPPTTLETANVTDKVLLFVYGFHMNFQLLLYIKFLVTNWARDIFLIRVSHHVHVKSGRTG